MRLDAETAIALRQRYSFVFGPRGFPGETFRVNTLNSFIGDNGQLVIYTDRWDGSTQTWLAFAKASEEKLRAEMVRL